MTRYLVTLRTHTHGPTDEVFVEVRAESFVVAIRDAIRACSGVGPFALMRAVPWPRGVRDTKHAAERARAGM